MPFTPDPPFPKTQGDNVRSKDWNDALAEVIRLDSAKANRAGDRFTGPLSVDGALGVGLGAAKPSESLEVNGRVKAGALTIGPWPFNPDYVFIGSSVVDQTKEKNYALLQGSAGGDAGVTFLNSPANIRFRIANVDKMVLAANGNLSILGQTQIVGTMSAQNFVAGAPFRIGAGRTPAGANWLVYSTNGIYINVDATSAGFTKPPIYITALGGSSLHWATTGATSIYTPTAAGFTVYVKWSDSSALTPAQAASFGWFIQWIGIEI